MNDLFFTRVNLLGSVIGSCGVYDEVSRVFSIPRFAGSCCSSDPFFNGNGHHVVSFLDDHP